MEEGEEQDPDSISTTDLLNLIGDVHAIHEQLKEVEVLKYKLRYSKKVVAYAEKKCENYQDLLRRADAENYELKKCNITLDQHNQLQKELYDLKAEHHNLVNWAEIRYQNTNQELITVTNNCNRLEKENGELREQNKKLLSQGQVLQLTKSRDKPKKSKNKEVKDQVQQEHAPEESQQLAELEEVLNTERGQAKQLSSKFNALQEQYNEIVLLNEQLQKQISKNEKIVYTLNDQLRNKETEIKKITEEKICGSIQATTCTDDNLPMIFNQSDDHNKTKINKEVTVELQPESGWKESQLADLELVVTTKCHKIKELTIELNTLQEHHKNEKQALNNTINTLNDQLRNRDTEMKKLTDKLNALQLQINLSGPTLENCDVHMPIFNKLDDRNKTEMPHFQHQWEDIDRDDTSDPPTDNIHSILNEMRHASKLITPFPFESDVEPTQIEIMQVQEPIAEPKQLNNENPISKKKLNIKRKKLQVISKRWLSRIKSAMVKKISNVRSGRLKMTRKLHFLENEVRMMKEKVYKTESNRVYHDQSTQCSDTNKEGMLKAAELPPLNKTSPNTINTEKKVLLQQLKIKKNIKQQLLGDLRKWHTDSYLSYPSAESDVESGLSQSTIRRKKFRKQRHKQITHYYSDDDDMAVDEDVLKKKTRHFEKKNAKTSDLILNDTKATQGDKTDPNLDSSETIYAKAQGSVDSGYVKTDSGGESDGQSKKRKISPIQNETCKKQRHINSPKEVQPGSHADVKYWTRSMVKLFGTDSESHSSCLDANTQKVVRNTERKPTVKYLQRVECERSCDPSSESDFLKGFVNDTYSSISKKNALNLSLLNAASVTKVSNPKITKKYRKIAAQKQETVCKDFSIDLILNDLNLSEGCSTTETDTKKRNPLLDDGTQSLTCKVISTKPLTASNRRSRKKGTHFVPSPTKMVLRSATKKTDDESAKSSNECRICFGSPSIRKLSKPTSTMHEIESTDTVGKKRIAALSKWEKATESADSETGRSRKRKVNSVVCKTTQRIRMDYYKPQNNDLQNSGINSVKSEGEEVKTSSDGSEITGKRLRLSSRIAGIKNKSVTDDETSINNCKNSENNSKSLRISARISQRKAKSGTDDEKRITNSINYENMGRTSRIGVGISGTSDKSETDVEKSVINNKNSENKGRISRIGVGISGTDVEKSVINSKNSENKGRTSRIGVGISGTSDKSGTDVEKSVSNSKNSESKGRTSRIGVGISGTSDKSGTDVEKSVINSKNSENKGRTSRISAGKSGTGDKKCVANVENSENITKYLFGTDDENSTTDDENCNNDSRANSSSTEQAGTKNNTSKKTKTGQALNTTAGKQKQKEKPAINFRKSKVKSGSSSEESRIIKQSANSPKNHAVDEEKSKSSDSKPGDKRNSTRKSESSESKNKEFETKKYISKLSNFDNHLSTNALTYEQLSARKRVVDVLKFTTTTNNKKEQISFKRPNTRRTKIEPLALLNPDPKVTILESSISTISHCAAQNINLVDNTVNQHIIPEPTLKSDLDLQDATVNSKFITLNQLTKAPAKVITDEKNATSESPDYLDFESPASPNPEPERLLDVEPEIIPLEVQDGTSRAKSVVNQLLHYCKSAGMAQEVTNALLCENPHSIAKLILEVISQDIHAKVELFKYRRAPLLTITQRVMLGLLLDLEEKGLKGVIISFLTLSEQFLIGLKNPLHIAPTARLHAAICKMQFDYKRMRLMLCKAVFFMGDAAIPYLYIVLCSWLELIPSNNDNLSGRDSLQVRTLVQIIRLKRCTEPNYNLHNLQTLLKDYYKFEFDREDSEKLLEDLFRCFIKHNRTVLEDVTSESMMYLTAALCESLDKKVVFRQVDKLKIYLVTATNDEIYGIIYLVGIITSQYCEDSDITATVSDNKDWLQQFCCDSHPDYIRNAAEDVLRKF